MIVRFVDIVGIYDHNSLNFRFIMSPLHIGGGFLLDQCRDKLEVSWYIAIFSINSICLRRSVK